MQKTMNNFYEKTMNSFINVVSRIEYTVNIMCIEKILLMQKQILSMQKNRFNYCEIKT